MTRCMVAVCAVVALFVWASTATADVELKDVDLQNVTDFTKQGANGVLNGRSDIPENPGTRFDITLTGSTWQDIQIGDGFDLPSNNAGIAILAGVPRTDGMPDFTALSSYEMTIHNPNSSGWFMANIYMNTGATDLSEPDNFYENGWAWVAPGASVNLSIDFSTATGPNDLTPGVDNLDHISNIGLKIGSNMGNGDYHMPSGLAFNVDVIPAPGAALLGLMGMSMVGWAKRRFS